MSHRLLKGTENGYCGLTCYCLDLEKKRQEIKKITLLLNIVFHQQYYDYISIVKSERVYVSYQALWLL